MQALRQSTMLARLVVAWFALTLGVAIASPFVHPQAMELVCSGGSIKMVAIDDGAAMDASHHTLDCPLCLVGAVPLPPALGHVPLPQPLQHALHPLTVAHMAALVGAPLPPRGPPAAT